MEQGHHLQMEQNQNTESLNPRAVWVGRDLKDPPILKEKITVQGNKVLQPQSYIIPFTNPINLLAHSVLVEKMHKHIFRRNSEHTR